MSIRPAPPPSPQEVHRKLSVHANPVKRPAAASGALSGTESDSDSQPVDVGSPPLPAAAAAAAAHASGSQQRLQSIAERRSLSGDESDEDDEEDGEWRVADKARDVGEGKEESIVKSGYLWKKGSRRKTWKKRWFVLRSPHLAYYKTSAEYQLLRLLDLNEVHSVTPVALKRHANTFGLVLPTRTFYVQAASQEEVAAWVGALNEVRERLQNTATITSVPTPPIKIPSARPSDAAPGPVTPVTPSPPYHAVTSSDEDDGAAAASSPSAARTLSPARGLGTPIANEPTKVVLSGYLMKCASKRKSWRKRWFVLTGEKLLYCGNHMDTKHQRQIPLAQILDAMEFPTAAPRHGAGAPGGHAHAQAAPPAHAVLDELADAHSAAAENHTFKIVTTKRSLLLCAPSEEEEIRWLSAVRALLARRAAGDGGAGAGAGAGSGAGRGAGRRRSISAGGLAAAVEEVVGGG